MAWAVVSNKGDACPRTVRHTAKVAERDDAEAELVTGGEYHHGLLLFIRYDATSLPHVMRCHEEGPAMTVQHRILESSSKSWETLCAEASAFASEVGREKLINISVAASGGTDVFGLGASGVIVVWYWE
jgi:hypothetical protein